MHHLWLSLPSDLPRIQWILQDLLLTFFSNLGNLCNHPWGHNKPADKLQLQGITCQVNWQHSFYTYSLQYLGYLSSSFFKEELYLHAYVRCILWLNIYDYNYSIFILLHQNQLIKVHPYFWLDSSCIFQQNANLIRVLYTSFPFLRGYIQKAMSLIFILKFFHIHLRLQQILYNTKNIVKWTWK